MIVITRVVLYVSHVPCARTGALTLLPSGLARDEAIKRTFPRRLPSRIIVLYSSPIQ